MTKHRFRVSHCVLWSFLALPFPASAQQKDEATGFETLAAISTEEVELFTDSVHDYWDGRFPEDEADPAIVFAAMLEDGKPLREAALDTGNRFGLSASRGLDMAFGLIAAGDRDRRYENDARWQSAIDALYRVLEASPRLTGVWARLGDAEDENGDEQCEERLYLERLFAEGVDYAMKVHTVSQCDMIALRTALVLAPEASSTLEELYSVTYYPPTDIAIAERWREALLAEGVAPLDKRHIDASVRLADELPANHVLAFVDGLPQEVRDRVLHRSDEEEEPDALGHYVSALLASGRRPEARGYLPDLQARAERCSEAPHFDCSVWTVLTMLIEGGDAFDLFKSTMSSAFGHLDEELLYPVLFDFYSSAGYPEIAERYAPGGWLYYAYTDERDRLDLAQLLGESFLDRRRYYEELLAPFMLKEPAASSASRTVQPETSTVFQEQPLPGDESSGDECRTLDTEKAVEFKPLDLWPVRAQQCGDTTIVLGTSQSLDPVGELSGGGYWLALSRDGGRHWREIYTGLRIYFPYVARAESEIPMLHGEHVQIHADLRELDVKSISFPPIALTALRRKDNLLLTAPLAELQRDSDGDGLPDLVESRLLLDAHDPDFDDDGIEDGYDMQPNVAAGELTEKGAAFALVLEEVFGYDSAAIVPGLYEGQSAMEALEAMDDSPPVLPSRTLFLVADPALLAGQLIPFRAIVLTPEQAQRVRQEQAVFMPLDLTNLWFSKDGRRALLQWSAGWTGGTIYLQRTELGHWKKEVLSNWIT